MTKVSDLVLLVFKGNSKINFEETFGGAILRSKRYCAFSFQSHYQNSIYTKHIKINCHFVCVIICNRECSIFLFLFLLLLLVISWLVYITSFPFSFFIYFFTDRGKSQGRRVELMRSNFRDKVTRGYGIVDITKLVDGSTTWTER